MYGLNQTVLTTGILAGIAAALLVLGANAQPSFAFVLYASSALPVLVAGLGWGNRTAIVAITTAAVLGVVLGSPMFALAMAIFTLIPAGWLSHLANLARPAAELGGPADLVAWYPISDILLHLCGLVTIAVIILGVVIGYGPELTNALVDAMAESFNRQDPSLVPDAASLAQTKALIVLMLPMIQGGLWVMLLFTAFYLAVRIVSRSGRALRPREDMPSALRMNRNAIFIFLGGILLTFVGGVPAMIGATVCGTFGAGFLMAGFAALHFNLKGKDWRLPALVLAYLSSLLFLPLLAVVVLGLTDTRRTIALTPARKQDTDES
ncbi:DUF2232 domain-containing protein [Rhizobium sp. SSA_523]|uniref:DUF2232 domain-containing protein n=1 Tax=Rhizobium sp. SSA_523 TaxID=2952477 RepID=UPI0020903073|nr:DUF2232 domain-containing protein [Rhizobium sp. SSA_523]MCO5730777.1 DUF2232 domain-containing protein [Rhizobium sp. SSA_523]WKC24400.1 DUF2232 domain-containing protein [Rhizobium sp. SSA_523]